MNPVAQTDETGNEYAHVIVETLREPLLILDGALKVQFANPAFYRTFDVIADETLGRHVYDLGEGQWDIPALRALLREVIDHDRPIENFRVDHEFATIGARVMFLNAHCFHLSGNSDAENSEAERTGAERIVLAIEDVTDRERVRDQLADYAVRIERSNRALEEFATIASHDLQEPLRKIVAFGERLEGVAAPVLDEQGRDYLTRMLDAGHRMRVMVNDLLAYSRVSRKDPEIEPVPLEKVIAGVLSDLQVPLLESGAQVEVGSLPVVNGDPSLLRLLVQNLVGNAIKYRVEDHPPEIWIEAESDGQEVHLRVRDRGIGFDEAYLDRIFDPFQRLHGRGTYEGSGIGLAICRGIAESHGGRITAESTPGEGATFIVTLPLANKGEAP